MSKGRMVQINNWSLERRKGYDILKIKVDVKFT